MYTCTGVVNFGDPMKLGELVMQCPNLVPVSKSSAWYGGREWPFMIHVRVRADLDLGLVYVSVELERLRHGRVQTKTKARRRQ